MVWQDTAWLLAEVEHAYRPHVSISGPACYPIEGWTECERCRQHISYTTGGGEKNVT